MGEEAAGPVIQDLGFEEVKKGLIEDGLQQTLNIQIERIMKQIDGMRDYSITETLHLIDVRDKQEIQTQGRIPRSVNIPLPEVPDAFRHLSDEEFKSKYGFCKKDENFAFSCRSGKRAEAAIGLVYNGDPSIINFKLYRGSFMDWEANGGPIEK